jgi:transcriptional regulator with XRE-family HTH domain
MLDMKQTSIKFDINKIIKLRKSKNLSIKKFAEMLGVTTKTIYNWENSVSKPGKTDLLAIAHILNVRINDISEFKESSLRYIKPTLNKNNSIHESTSLLKNIINEAICGDYAGLIPLLHAEDEISRLNIENTKLVGRTSRLKLILDLIATPVYIKNTKRIVTYANQAFLNILTENINEYDVIGHKFSDIFSSKEFLPITRIENKVFNGSHINNIPIVFPIKSIPSKCSISIKPIQTKNSKSQEIIVTIKI